MRYFYNIKKFDSFFAFEQKNTDELDYHTKDLNCLHQYDIKAFGDWVYYDHSLNANSQITVNLVGCQGASYKAFQNSPNKASDLVSQHLFTSFMSRDSGRNSRFDRGLLSPQSMVANLIRETSQRNETTILLGDNFYPYGLRPKRTNRYLSSKTLLELNYYRSGTGNLTISNENYKRLCLPAFRNDMYQEARRIFMGNFNNLPYGRSFAILGNHDWDIWSHSKTKDNYLYNWEAAYNQIYASRSDWTNTKHINENEICSLKTTVRNRFIMPNRYYITITSVVIFYYIDSSTFPFDERQQDWLIEQYRNLAGKHNSKWHILVSHHALYSVGKRAVGAASGKWRTDANKYAKAFVRCRREKVNLDCFNGFSLHTLLSYILEKYKIRFHVVLSAHDHFQAAYPIYFDNGRTSTLQIISGNGGAHLNSINRSNVDSAMSYSNPDRNSATDIMLGLPEYNRKCINQMRRSIDTFGYIPNNAEHGYTKLVISNTRFEYTFYTIDGNKHSGRWNKIAI